MFFVYNELFSKRYIFLTYRYKGKNSNDPKAGKQKPVLEVLSAGNLVSLKKSKVLLENIEEKSLDTSSEQLSFISSESLKKLKEKIIGKTPEDEYKG